jgi:glyoxylase-like metal-dependent hydrolase (beta-lactamase superfamily II)
LPPDVTQILPGLARFTIPFPKDPKRKVNSFVFTAGREALLLDASWDVPEALEGLEAALQLSGLGLAAVSAVVITHLHPDHLGLAGRLSSLGARVGYHPAEEMVLLTRFRRLEEFRAHTSLWERLNGYPKDADPVFSGIATVEGTLHEVPHPDLPLEGGETLEIGDFRLRPVWTPGHTLGHLCYYEETRRLLFTGDHVLPTISPHIGMYVHAIGNPLPNYLDSLALLRSYQPEMVLPAHGEPFADLHARLAELLEHHHERMEEMFQIVGQEPLTAWEVASRARWTRRKISLNEIAPWHRRLALAETIAHLELLRAEGRLAKEFAPGRMLYRQPGARA